MTIDQAAADVLALELRESERRGRAVPLVSERISDLDEIGARRIALARDALRLADGDDLIGYKLGWTSAAMRTALGIDRPNWGTLWRSQSCDGALHAGALRHAKVEPEIVFVADRDLAGAEVTAHEVAAAARGWAVGIEVVHPRWPTFDFTWLDNTADNSSAHAFAVGAPTALDGDPADVEVLFSHGAETRHGTGHQAMGSPAEAVAWLVRALSSEGSAVAAGQIVFTGGITAPFDVVEGGEYTARSPRLGSVGLEVGSSRAGATTERT